MGFLGNLFRGASAHVEPDSIWQTAAARSAGLAARVEEHAGQRQVLLLAHFPATLEDLAETLAGRLTIDRARSETDIADALSAPSAGSICLALVSQLPATPPAIVDPVSTPVSFLVAERHPLRIEDERVERLAAALPYEASVRFHLSLEDPLLQEFSGDRITALMGQLGMAEDEELTHSLIARAVERAQERLAERTRAEGPVEADSFEDWTAQAIDPE